jgi:hypothetical protein
MGNSFWRFTISLGEEAWISCRVWDGCMVADRGHRRPVEVVLVQRLATAEVRYWEGVLLVASLNCMDVRGSGQAFAANGKREC